MSQPSDTAVFRLGYVPGVTPGKWARIWAERRPQVPLELVTATTDEAVELIRTGAVDAALVRLPIDRTGLHAIPLYTETTVAVVPKEHVLTATEEATVADRLGVSISGLARAEITEPLTTAQIVALKEEQPEWLRRERTTRAEAQRAEARLRAERSGRRRADPVGG